MPPSIKNVFLTGGTGFIGAQVAKELVSHGYAVRGLARSNASAAKLESLGVTAVRGDLTTLDVAVAEANAADAVVHLAVDFTALNESLEQEKHFIAAVGAAYKGTGKTFLITSGTFIGIGSGRTPFTEADDGVPGRVRYDVEATLRALGGDGVRALVIRPPLVHGDVPTGLVRAIIEKPKALGYAPVVEGGAAKWPYVDVADLAVVYRLALEKAPEGFSRYHGVDESTPNRAVADAAAEHWGVPVKEVTVEEATKIYGFFGSFLGSDNTVSSEATRAALGWEIKGKRFLDKLEDGTYWKQL
ncbi:hypothetical protein Q8F55_007840 [Vanrija albida]|uniref:NAD-dependent epimerase/dehydratase domain-containing protein n=1 Tax=Vanrija albida TaxID=181172 RepID=A0ABR3PUY5_9TREE